MIVALLAISLLLSGCAPREQPTAQQPMFTRTVDLSHVVRQDVPYLPDEPPMRIGRDADGSVRQIEIGARTGTLLRLVAAPASDLRTVDQLSPRELVLPAVVIDVRDRAQDHAGYQLSTAELDDWERRHGVVPRGALVLLVTGWDLRWGDPASYIDHDGAGQMTAPAFGAAAAATLLDDREVIGLGIDAPGAAYAPSSGYRLLLENLTSLEQLPATGATIIVGALKLQAAQSSPARVIALIP
ncbi:cyclase family protein [Oscillochloris sp. ZM17-4]|uniref:cyclase family protein n=1 Tax=Oscillochloris sp. ZM17-4 TaxID=2866714 RepID=UPI001C73A5F5|nr:cyclase family protein [Oscillochloris sp. ZM17-4]MBX0327938.1 cyclase family protein [Oscillochloris sp. ZM17-4]